MFTFYDGKGCSRRAFLTVGGLGLAGLSLPTLFATRAAAASRPVTTGKAVIFLFQHGGPTQFETFDPKMSAPEGVRSITGETATSLPGVTFGGTMTGLARHADKIAIVRSFQTQSSAHGIRPVVGPETLNAHVGSLYARVVGATRPNGMPSNVMIFPNAVDPKAPGANDRFGKFTSTGNLGAAFTPFVPGAGGTLQQNMRLNLPRERLEDRKQLLGQLDQLRRQMDATGSMQAIDRFQEQAFDVITGSVAEAFDLAKEDPKTIARYDTAHLSSKDGWSKVNNGKKGYYTAHSMSLGKLLLMARRLCEAGAGFVTINTEFVWDFHADQNNLGPKDGMEAVGKPFDHAVSAFIDDVEARGLRDRILLVATGEMGRTPKVNKNGGRDHWGKLTPLMVYGGGTRGGQVIGQSSRDGGEPASDPVTAKHLVSTLMHTVFDIGELRVTRGVPTDVARVITEGGPVPGLI